jgi:xylulokinase
VSLLLGIDVGTTGVRVAAFDLEGHLAAESAEPCPHTAPSKGWAEEDPEVWWGAVRSICHRVVADVGADEILAVGVTGQAPTAVLVDA